MLLMGCISGPRGRFATAMAKGNLRGALAAYDALARVDGINRGMLDQLARLTLVEAAVRGDDRQRRAAFRQLRMAGIHATGVLRTLAGLHSDDAQLHVAGPLPAPRPGPTSPSALMALEALAQRGDIDARLLLRGLADDKRPQVLRAALLGMDPETDRPQIRALTAHPDPHVRARAAARLRARSAKDTLRLATLARRDPAPEVRRAAVQALGRSRNRRQQISDTQNCITRHPFFCQSDNDVSSRVADRGVSNRPYLTVIHESDTHILSRVADRGVSTPSYLTARAALRERLSDSALSVRTTAVRALHAVGDAATLGELVRHVTPSPVTIEAARLLLPRRCNASSAARALLVRAMRSPRKALRIQAAVALTSVPESDAGELRTLAVQRLAMEPSPRVRLALARALRRADPGTARNAFTALLETRLEIRLEAAAELLQLSSADAVDIIWSTLLDASIPSRLRARAAAIVAAHSVHADAARHFFVDPDPLVRIAIAGGMLRRSN